MLSSSSAFVNDVVPSGVWSMVSLDNLILPSMSEQYHRSLRKWIGNAYSFDFLIDGKQGRFVADMTGNGGCLQTTPCRQ
jgi:hypothetical protein